MSIDHSSLERATALVAGTYDGPHCVEAAALLLEVGAALGYELEARPVSMFATNLTPMGNQVTGQLGHAYGESYLHRHGVNVEVVVDPEVATGTPFQRNAGHMIVVSPEHELLMDPTFSQFKQLGPSATALFARETPLKAGRFWEASDGTFYVRYFAADDFMELEFAAQRAAAGPRAKEIAKYIARTT